MGKFFKNKKTGFGVLAFLALMLSIVLSCLLPENRMPIRAIGVLTSCFVLWISEAMPISVSTLLMIALLPVLGLMDFETILSSMGINSALFIMASSGMTIALCNSAIPKALTNAVLKKTYRHPTILIASVAILVSLFSAFVSSLATCVLFTGLISGMLHEAGIRPKESRMGKNLLIIIPACSGIGGFMTPAGTPANILVIDLLKTKGIEISFLKWCAIGFPLGILATILFTLSVILIFKPSKETKYEVPINRICFSKDDKNVLCIVVLTIIGWIVSGFIPGVNITMVALIGVALFFLPPIRLLDMNRFSRGVNWDLVISMGTVSVLMTAISNSGLLSSIIGLSFRHMGSMLPIVVLISISASICVLRSFIPTTTAVIALFAPALITVSEISGLNLVTLLLIASFWAASALLFIYTEPIYLIAYKEGFFKETDLLKVGIAPSFLLIIAAPLLISWLTNLVLR